jgi:hypothetical protein
MGSHIKDKETRKPGKRLFVRKIRWLRRDRVQVRGGFAAGGLNAMSGLFTLEKKGKLWRVVKVSGVVMS